VHQRRRRQITLRSGTARSARQRPHRADLGTLESRYAARAGVEGTMRQATCHRDPPGTLPRIPKTQLEHNIAAAAINMIRMDAYWTGHP